MRRIIKEEIKKEEIKKEPKMCKLKSGIILKDKVFMPDYDSHAKMLEELKISDTSENSKNLFIRAELIPHCGDVFSPIEDWSFNVDQDIIPEWFSEEREKARMIEAVKVWARQHIYINKSNFSVKRGNYYLKSCKKVFCHNSTVEAYGYSVVKSDNSTVKAYDRSVVVAYNSTVEAHNLSRVEACDNSTVEAYNHSTVYAFEKSIIKSYNSSKISVYDNSLIKAYNVSTVNVYSNSTIEACDSSTVELNSDSTVKASGNSTVYIPSMSYADKIENIELIENSTLKDCKRKTIYQSGKWKLVAVENVG